mmetsp:Transcript_12099/g.34243  ORF Transcript_12099/g.34243 Transcript_12099/m.34243 type:complete len:218 (-) Transcript_12099:580-1233(-)
MAALYLCRPMSAATSLALNFGTASVGLRSARGNAARPAQLPLVARTSSICTSESGAGAAAWPPEWPAPASAIGDPLAWLGLEMAHTVAGDQARGQAPTRRAFMGRGLASTRAPTNATPESCGSWFPFRLLRAPLPLRTAGDAGESLCTEAGDGAAVHGAASKGGGTSAAGDRWVAAGDGTLDGLAGQCATWSTSSLQPSTSSSEARAAVAGAPPAGE